ncbi:MAG: TolC family protein, partial [Spirochaetota bacterium]
PASTPAQDRPGPPEPLSLEAAVDRAREASQSLERSRLEIDVARAELAQARASLLPQIAANLGLAHIGNPSQAVTIPAGAFGVVPGPSAGQFIPIPDDEVEVFPEKENLGISASVEIDQPIFTSGKLRSGVDAALVAVETSALTRADVLSEQSRYASARLELVRARQALATGEANLVWLIGAEPGELEALDLPGEPPDEAELVERARAGHPRLDELRMTASRAAIGVEAAAAASLMRPDVGLRVKAEVVGQTFPFVEDEWKESWDANLTISVGTSATVFDGGSSRARRETAEARLAGARSAITEFSDSLERYFVAQAVVSEVRAQLAAAEEQVRVARVSFENELITRSDVLGARLGVLEAQLAAIGAELDGVRAMAEIEYLAGTYRKTD